MNKGGITIINIILLLLGFIFLIKGADFFVDSASFIARKFGIPAVIVGMTIVAMGTSAPELSVSINSALSGLNDMSIANVVGSNIFNLLAALGISSLFNTLKISNYKDVFIMFASSVILMLLAIDGHLALIDGLIMLAFFTCYMLMMIRQSKQNKEVVAEQEDKPLFKTILLGLLGLIGIIIGGDFVVDSASAIALQLGMSENLVGLTIVALGTSLPETITSVMATRKGELDIAIGNIIGSNIFNILLILGIASSISPMIVTSLAMTDITIMIASVLLFITLTYKKRALNKSAGLLLICVYVMYIISTIIR